MQTKELSLEEIVLDGILTSLRTCDSLAGDSSNRSIMLQVESYVIRFRRVLDLDYSGDRRYDMSLLREGCARMLGVALVRSPTEVGYSWLNLHPVLNYSKLGLLAGATISGLVAIFSDGDVQAAYKKTLLTLGLALGYLTLNEVDKYVMRRAIRKNDHSIIAAMELLIDVMYPGVFERVVNVHRDKILEAMPKLDEQPSAT